VIFQGNFDFGEELDLESCSYACGGGFEQVNSESKFPKNRENF